MSKIALVDDEVELREGVAAFLRGHGHQVTELGSCAGLRGSLANAPSDIALVDRTQPDGDGLHAVAELLHKHSQMGVIMFTARDTLAERRDGLHHGADHYLAKPVSFEELLAVIKSLSRRVNFTSDWKIDSVDFSLINLERRRISLTPQEYRFLDALNNAPWRSLTRTQIMHALDKRHDNYSERTWMRSFCACAKSLGSHQPTFAAKNIHGTGYSLTVPLLRHTHCSHSQHHFK